MASEPTPAQSKLIDKYVNVFPANSDRARPNHYSVPILDLDLNIIWRKSGKRGVTEVPLRQRELILSTRRGNRDPSTLQDS